jgi:hypothetical protein
MIDAGLGVSWVGICRGCRHKKTASQVLSRRCSLSTKQLDMGMQQVSNTITGNAVLFLVCSTFQLHALQIRGKERLYLSVTQRTLHFSHGRVYLSPGESVMSEGKGCVAYAPASHSIPFCFETAKPTYLYGSRCES